jgi:1,4-alpha-glucan branching enzyme
MPGRLVFVMHAHLPYVLGQGEWPHGTAWLYEAAVDTYLPLLRGLERLVRSGVRPGFTIEISPVLGDQLDDDRFRHGCARHLDALVAAAERNAADSDAHVAALAADARRRYGALRDDFAARDGRIVDGFAALDRSGDIELFTCARTHGFLPLLGTQDRVERQVEAGVAWFEQRFGRRPAGMWLPECAYRPAGPWAAPGGEPAMAHRPGLEEVLEQAGVQWTVVDAHLVTGGVPVGNYPPWRPGDAGGRSPHRMHTIGASSVVAFARDPATTLQVWSAEQGYPGNPWYLEFHKRHHDGGLRYWRVTDRALGLGEKSTYDPGAAGAAVGEQARHFADLVAATIVDSRRAGVDDPVVTAPYDAELFGHWWREGVEWLVAARMALADRGVPLATAGEACRALAATPLSLPAGSWGADGDFRVWDNPSTTPLWRLVDEAVRWLAEVEAAPIASEAASVVADQLARTVFLIESSDWLFLTSTGTAEAYAGGVARRFHDAARRLVGMWRRLLDGDDLTPAEAGSLAAMRERDRIRLQ